MTTIVALHGDFANPDMFRRDVGIRDWLYVDWKRYGVDGLASIITRHRSNILVGYSRGGSAVAKLTHQLDNVLGAILYEAPILPPRNQIQPVGNFPVLWIENDKGKGSKNRRTKKIMKRSKQLWSKEHSITCLTGGGKHVKVNPLGHAWDQSLNPEVLDWIKRIVD